MDGANSGIPQNMQVLFIMFFDPALILPQNHRLVTPVNAANAAHLRLKNTASSCSNLASDVGVLKHCHCSELKASRPGQEKH